MCRARAGAGREVYACKTPPFGSFHCCMRKRLISSHLCLSLSLSLHSVVGCSRKKESHATKLLIVECDGARLLLIIQPFSGGGGREQKASQWGAVHLLQCLHKYLRIIRRFQRGYYAIFLLILLCLAAGNREEREKKGIKMYSKNK